MTQSPLEILIAVVFLVAVLLGYAIVRLPAGKARLISDEGIFMPPIRYVIAGIFVGLGVAGAIGHESGLFFRVGAGALAAAAVGALFALFSAASWVATGFYAYADDADPSHWIEPRNAGAPRFLFPGEDMPLRLGRQGTTNHRSGVAVLALLLIFLMEIATTFGLAVFGLAIFDGFGFSSAFEVFLSAMVIFIATLTTYVSIVYGLPWTRYNLWAHSPGGMVSLMNMMGWPVRLVEVAKQDVAEPSAELVDTNG